MISGVINGVFYDLFERTAKAFIDRLNISTENQVAFHCHGTVGRTAFLDAGKKIRCLRPRQGHIRRSGRPPFKPDPAAVQDDRPFKVPILKHPERFQSCFTYVLTHGAIAAREDKRLLDQAARCSL